jgi:hypothetical protein
MELPTLWFVLIAVLFIAYFFLEGFDFGVGILMPFISEDNIDRRVTLNAIGPFGTRMKSGSSRRVARCLPRFRTGMRPCSVVFICRCL